MPGENKDAAVQQSADALPKAFSLAGNIPNPFRGATTLHYTLPSASDVTIEVFDMLGRRVAMLVDGPQKAGRHEVRWEARGVAGGAYVCRMRAGAFAATSMMMLVR